MRAAHLQDHLLRFVRAEAPVDPGDRVVVAFSGGPDSCALLATFASLRERLGIDVLAAHFDHRLDPGSAERAHRAAALAARLDVPFALAGVGRPLAGHGPEEGARLLRYRALGRLRRALGARYLATAHHRGDQAETVVLRLAFGSGIAGLAGIAPRRGAVIRPFLDLVPATLRAIVAVPGLAPIEDPTNRCTAIPRNRVRHLVLPRLAAEDGVDGARLARLATRAAGARRTLARRLLPRLDVRREPGGASLELAALAGLPFDLWPAALALLGRTAGRRYPAPAAARTELRRQVRAATSVGCDCGARWRWEGRGDRLVLRRPGRRSAAGFSYTLEVPGAVRIPELGLTFRMHQAATAPWMFEGARDRAGLALPLATGDAVVIRSRRPGDRLRLLGCAYERRLKSVLIDRKVPRAARDRLPLLVVGSTIAWVPGVAVADSFRLDPSAARTAWICEVRPHDDARDRTAL